jgi:bis(5'-nucleosyl)-tetraphosphatase (symmetrical)
MATYAIGDVQGCWRPLKELLARISFSASRDSLWLTGDLVNRGPASLDVLRFCADLGDAVHVVLGNHDLHTLGRAAGVRRRNEQDSVEAIFEAPDRDTLLAWLEKWPLMLERDGLAMVHAGLLPQWTVAEARALAAEAKAALYGAQREALLAAYGDDTLDTWHTSLSGPQRLQTILNAFTRLRVCTPAGQMVLGFAGSPAAAPAGLVPWFDAPARKSRTTTVLFGHWAALGLLVRDDVVGLDAACVWGQSLAAVRLEDRGLFTVSCT